MKFFSTRGAGPVSLDVALRQGIAEDGGLFLPDQLPHFSPGDFAAADSIEAVATVMMRPFFAESELRDDVEQIVAETFGFDVPVKQLPTESGWLGLLELFHGPTAAFKDVGAGFLAACLSRLEGDPDAPLTILVATSGDTGGAVAAAFDKRPGMRVAVLFPDGRVSARQEHQLCCWSDNVLSLRVTGAFDDCQAMVKAAMADAYLSARHRFSSANSINIGRLLPQSTYYADASLRHYRETGNKASFIIPTGNLGNGFACVMARAMGLPIGDIVLATNENRTIVDYFETHEWQPRSSLQTLASAMDVGDPSNMERLRHLLGDAESLGQVLHVSSVNDDQIRTAIQRHYKEYGTAVCPHTATAVHGWHQFSDAVRKDRDWIVVATAHPAKFETVVEPLIDDVVPLPAELADILARPARATQIEPSVESLAAALSDH